MRRAMILCLFFVCLPTSALGDDAIDQPDGLVGVGEGMSTSRIPWAEVALQAQTRQAPKGGQLSERVHVKSLQRLADSFEQPLERTNSEPKRD